MGLLDQNSGFREITVEALGSIGFKPTKVDLWINGVQMFPYDLYIKIPGEPSWSGKHHLFRYFPNNSKLEIFENRDAWSYQTRREIYVNCFEDVVIFVESYRR